MEHRRALPVMLWACAQLLACGAGQPIEATKAVRVPGVSLAADDFAKQCREGQAASCTALGLRHARGPTVNMVWAAKLFARACGDGDMLDPAGCGELAVLVEMGWGGLAPSDERAAKLYRRACDGGHAASCRRLGPFVERGRAGLSPTDAEAQRLYEKACDAGDGEGCSLLARAIERVRHKPDEKKLAALYRRACEREHEASCHETAMRLMMARGVARDWSAGKALLQRACDSDVEASCRELAGIEMWREPFERHRRSCELKNESCSLLAGFYRGNYGVEPDPKRAMALLQKLCAGDDAHACTSIGEMHETGEAGAVDYKAAVTAYTRACEQGAGYGCYRLAKLHEAGKGVEKSSAKAMSWLELACNENDDTAGCHDLGWMLERRGTEKDMPEVARLYRLACDRDRAEACSRLAELYRGGKGVPPSVRTAAQLTDRACREGHTASCLTLAGLLRRGDGIEKDVTRAIRILRSVCMSSPARCVPLGDLFAKGELVKRDDEEARWIYRRACDGGEGEGCHKLARMCAAGLGFPGQAGDASLWRRRACVRGYPGPGCQRK